MKKDFALALTLVGTMGLAGCQAMQPLGQGGNPVAEQQSGGGLGVQFNFGDQLTAADILAVEPAGAESFQVKHAGSDHLHYADVASATVTVTSPFVERPAVITLTRTEILDGWYYVFEKIPPGAAAISLEVKNKAGQKIFSAHKEVEVVAGNMTPVDFTLEFQNDASCGENPSCAGSGTGSIKVTVKAVTNCVACLKFNPLLARAKSPVAISLSQLQGNVEKFTLDTGDGTGKKDVKSWPYSHTYKDPKRYPVSVTLEGKGCKNPFTTKAYLSVFESDIKPTTIVSGGSPTTVTAFTTPNTGTNLKLLPLEFLKMTPPEDPIEVRTLQPGDFYAISPPPADLGKGPALKVRVR